MDIFDQILENLNLERDLGTRTVEIDRALLLPIKVEKREPVAESKVAKTHNDATSDIVFYTGRELSQAGKDAMEKIFAAIAKMKPGVKIALNEQCDAKVCVLLGADAHKKHNPTERPMRGNWCTVRGIPAITTFSPDYIFSHFEAGSPYEKNAKLEMWNEIKSAVAKIK
ncbi:MAG: hypothetical protein J6R18_04015 [Kiritimatiellae bacterium]|nr:hypothetical protein [Kiritimatiellia bacterium]